MVATSSAAKRCLALLRLDELPVGRGIGPALGDGLDRHLQVRG